MAEQLPIWQEVGVEPPELLRNNGWQPGMKPSAQHMNWLFNRIYKCLEEIQAGGGTEELEQELATLQQVVATHLAEKATTTGYGHTILNPTVTSTSNGEAATAGAVKIANDNANSRILQSSIGQPGGVSGLDENGNALNADGSLVNKRIFEDIAEIDISSNPTVSVTISNLELYSEIELEVRDVGADTSGGFSVVANEVDGRLMNTTFMGLNAYTNEKTRTYISAYTINVAYVSDYLLSAKRINGNTYFDFLYNTKDQTEIKTKTIGFSNFIENNVILKTLTVKNNAAIPMVEGIIKVRGVLA